MVLQCLHPHLKRFSRAVKATIIGVQSYATKQTMPQPHADLVTRILAQGLDDVQRPRQQIFRRAQAWAKSMRTCKEHLLLS
jgi:hypothetical protein